MLSPTRDPMSLIMSLMENYFGVRLLRTIRAAGYSQTGCNRRSANGPGTAAGWDATLAQENVVGVKVRFDD